MSEGSGQRGETNNGLAGSRTGRGPSRIIIADDHPLFRCAIRQTLEGQSDLEVIGEASNGREVVELCRRLRPDLVLMDLRMPQMDGVAATRAIKREFPETLVLILTAVDESGGLADSLEAGAAGYVLKDASAARITDAVSRTLAGESPLDEKVAMGLLTSLVSKDTRKKENQKRGFEPYRTPENFVGDSLRSRADGPLTPREVEILRHVARGQTNQQIARTLLISASTVKRHIRRISDKLEVCDRVQAAVRAVELGLLDERTGR